MIQKNGGKRITPTIAGVVSRGISPRRVPVGEASGRSTIDDVMLNADRHAEILAGLDAAVNLPAMPPRVTASV